MQTNTQSLSFETRGVGQSFEPQEIGRSPVERLDADSTDTADRVEPERIGSQVCAANSTDMQSRVRLCLRIAGGALVLALAVLFAMAPAIPNGFLIWDDASYVYRNPVVMNPSWSHFRDIFTHTYVSNYHPITWLSHQLDWVVWGDWPTGHHLTSVLLHGCNSALVFFLCVSLGATPRVALLGAAVFGVHPMQVQSVAWIAERKNVLCTLFCLLALTAQVRGGGRRLLWCHAAVQFLSLLALGSKPMAVALPVVAILLDVSVLHVTVVRAVRNQTLALCGAAVLSLVTWQAQSEYAISNSSHFSANVATALRANAFYIEKLLVPVELSAHYPRDPSWEVPGSATIAAMCTIGGLAALACWVRRRVAIWGLSFFFVMLAPVSGIVPIGYAAVADRYIYLPMVGLIAAATVCGRSCFGQRDRALGPFARRVKQLLYLSSWCLVGWTAVAARGECRVWRDDESLWRAVLARAPESGLARLNLGYYYWRNLRDSQRALEEFDCVEPQHPDGQYKLARLNRTVIQAELHGIGPETASAMEALLRTEPLAENRFVLPNLTAVYGELTRRFLAGNEFGAAMRYCEAALRIDENDRVALKRLAISLYYLGEYDRAVSAARRAAQLDPSDAAAQANLTRITDAARQSSRLQ